MGTIHIREFKGGLDTRRLVETSAGGTLIHAVDCHVTQGGEIEQRAAFVPVSEEALLPTGSSVGLWATNDELVVFGHSENGPSLPDGAVYYQLVHPTNKQILGVPAAVMFGPDLFTTARYDAYGGTWMYMFANEDLVTDADAPPNATGNDEPIPLLVHKSKLFVGAGTKLFFSAIRDGEEFTNPGGASDNGAGFIDLAFEIGRGARIFALAPYGQYAAVFFANDIMVWAFDADPNETAPIQTIAGTGTFAPGAVLPYREGDVLYYDPTGIRSLRARDSSGQALTVDIGSPIDSLTRAAYAALPADQRLFVWSVVDPLTGRAWFAIKDTIFVLSHYPETKITAWTTYKPGFDVEGMCVLGDRVYVRGNNQIYVYGGLPDAPFSYEGVEAEVWLPYLDANMPTQAKSILGLDAAARGLWEARIGFEPKNLAASDLLARFDGTTYGEQRIDGLGSGTHLGLRFRSLAPPSATTPAVLSSAVIHHNLDDPVDNS